MKALVIGIIVLALVVGLFLIFNSGEPNLAPGKRSAELKSEVKAKSVEMTADQLFSLVGKTGLEETDEVAAKFAEVMKG